MAPTEETISSNSISNRNSGPNSSHWTTLLRQLEIATPLSLILGTYISSAGMMALIVWMTFTNSRWTKISGKYRSFKILRQAPRPAIRILQWCSTTSSTFSVATTGITVTISIGSTLRTVNGLRFEEMVFGLSLVTEPRRQYLGSVCTCSVGTMAQGN